MECPFSWGFWRRRRITSIIVIFVVDLNSTTKVPSSKSALSLLPFSSSNRRHEAHHCIWFPRSGMVIRGRPKRPAPLLQSNELDLIVHSLKDMPTQLPVDLDLGCVTKRSDPRDALCIKPTLREKTKGLSDLPDGAVVGTSSLRRIAQLKRKFPRLKYTDVRGNIGTRLRKLEDPDSEYSAIVLAAAGLQRLGMLRCRNQVGSLLGSSHKQLPHIEPKQPQFLAPNASNHMQDNSNIGKVCGCNNQS